MAKAEAASRLAQLKGGVYWIGTDENLSERRFHNLLYLHARRQPFPTYEEIAATILAHWPWGEQHSVNEFTQHFGSRWSDAEVEAAVWKLVANLMILRRDEITKIDALAPEQFPPEQEVG